MRNLKNYLLILASMSIALFIACKEESTNSTSPGSPKIAGYFPVSQGSWWVYYSYRTDSLGNIIDSSLSRRDSVCYAGTINYMNRQALKFIIYRYHFISQQYDTAITYYAYDNSKLLSYQQLPYDNKVAWSIICDLDNNQWIADQRHDSVDSLQLVPMGINQYDTIHYQLDLKYMYETSLAGTKNFLIGDTNIVGNGYESVMTQSLREHKDGKMTDSNDTQLNYLQYFGKGVGLLESTTMPDINVQGSSGEVRLLVKYNVK